MKKPILCLDFDGVIHSYTSGWQGADAIPDPPVPGAIEFIADAVRHFDLYIYSARSNQFNGIRAMKLWLELWLYKTIGDNQEAQYVLGQIKFPKSKPPAMVTIDDRAIQFTGEFPDMETLKNFRPWNKQEV